MGKKVVIAIGGNSLIKDKQHQTVEDQYQAAYETSVHIAGLIKKGYNVVVTHGNGPQVGFILLRSELSKNVLHEVPLDFCGADTQGSIGYTIQQTLGNNLKKMGLDKKVVTVVTQVLVDKNDPSFQNPSKPIGPFYNKEEALKLQQERGWDIKEDAGRGYRRVVPSPIPKQIIEEDAIKCLVDQGFIVVGVGGGGIPVIEDENGNLKGVAAVIDKDRASSLLATRIQADMFIISTAVEKVYLNFGKPDQKPIDQMTVAEAKKYMEEGHFKPGSMLPKIESAIHYLEQVKHGKVIITNPENLERAVDGETGTHIVP